MMRAATCQYLGFALPAAKAPPTAKVVGTLWDLAAAVIGPDAAEAHAHAVLWKRVPLLSWRPAPDLAALDQEELAAWLHVAASSWKPEYRTRADAAIDRVQAAGRASGASYRDQLARLARLLLADDPIGFSRHGAYLVNWTESHAAWRTDALPGAIQARRLRTANDVVGVYLDWLHVATERTRTKAEARNRRPLFALDYESEHEQLREFAKTHPGVQYMTLRGFPYTRLAERVFAHLYGKLTIWLREAERAAPAALAWIDADFFALLRAAFAEGRFYLAEKAPREFGMEVAEGYTVATMIDPDVDQTPTLAIWVGFRPSFMRTVQVVSEDSLLLIALHELAHVLQDRYEPDDPSLTGRIARRAGESDASFENRKEQAMVHSTGFYRAFLFTYGMALRAGLLLPRVDGQAAIERWHDAENPGEFAELKGLHDRAMWPLQYDDAPALEEEFGIAPHASGGGGGMKRTREPGTTGSDGEDPSSFSDGEEAFATLFARYVGAPQLSRADIARVWRYWQDRGLGDAFITDVLSQA